MFNADKMTVKPGMLVSLKSTISGNVQYRRNTIESEHVTESGELHGRWETEKRVQDAAEHDRAKKVRSDARNAISLVCSNSSFGLLCPMENEAALLAAIAKAQSMVEEFNATAKLSTISVFVMTGRISENDDQTTTAINSEILDLLMAMADGLDAKDVKLARDACNRAVNLSDMLTPDAAGNLQSAIDATREACRYIVRNGSGGALAEQAQRTIERGMAHFGSNATSAAVAA